MIAYELFDLIWIACLTKKKKNTLYALYMNGYIE